MQEEIKKVSDSEYTKAYREMLEDFKAQTDGKFDGLRRIEFYFAHPDRDWKEPMVMQVNWAAIGTVTPEETAEFGKALMIAAKLAENFVYNGYEVYYED